nr:phosphate regulon sensor histidine kinase PhoR [Peteryoungia ipomoeae]
MSKDVGGGDWRSDMKHLVAGWFYILAAAILALAAYFTGAAAGFAVLLFVLLFGLILMRQVPSEDGDHGEPLVTLPIATAPDPMSVIRATIDAMDLPVFVLGDTAEFVAQNRAAVQVFDEVAVGVHVSARWRSPSILDMIRETMDTGVQNQLEHSERLPSERTYIVQVSRLQLEGQSGGTAYYLLVFRDISELRRLDRMRSDFVANASHELRTPLASLRGFIETMQGPARDDPKSRERFLGIMLDQANRMSRLVDDLLSLSRLELKAHMAPSEMVDLVPLIGHVCDSLAPLADDLDVELRLDLADAPLRVLGDRDELVQVFENLVENACKYGQEGKIVEVSLRHDPVHGIEFSVKDKGPGIPAEHVPRLTERFYRVNVEDSRSKKGTGLGLAIVKHILTRHRARLIVRSEIGKGSEFTVRF